VSTLSGFATDPDAPPFVMVTHHVDEIPSGVTHVALLQGGGVLAEGPVEATLTAEALSECFGLPLRLERRDDGRFTAWSPR
jgi:iron complex transport system ATP-binding protein